MPSTLISLLQALALLVLSLVVGAMFGVWRGFNPGSFSPATFVEVQQGAIRGLNNLLPAMGAISMVTVLLLAVFGRGRPSVLSLYLAAAAAMMVARLVTRFGNQPINAVVMSWSGLPPAGWKRCAIAGGAGTWRGWRRGFRGAPADRWSLRRPQLLRESPPPQCLQTKCIRTKPALSPILMPQQELFHKGLIGNSQTFADFLGCARQRSQSGVEWPE